MCVSFSFVSGAQAADFQPQNIIDASGEKNIETSRISAENSIIDKNISNQDTQGLIDEIKNKKSDTPSAILDPKSVEKAAEFAANATGVRKDFIMGMLVVESDLGRNTGKCTYREVEDGALKAHQNGNLGVRAWTTFKDRHDIIANIAESLNYDSAKLSVSCNPGSAYAGTGGAMGISQFMPDTWLEYKDRISAIVGKKNPDPWDEKDAVVAMALKLSDVSGVTSHSKFAERNAAKMYLSGSVSSRYDWYANQIFYWSENYSFLIG